MEIPSTGEKSELAKARMIEFARFALGEGVVVIDLTVPHQPEAGPEELKAS